MRFFIFILGSVISIALQAQKVENKSFVSPSGEKFLRLEITIPSDTKTAWDFLL
jgi:hypothetical protein